MPVVTRLSYSISLLVTLFLSWKLFWTTMSLVNYGMHTSASSSRGGTILSNDAYQWRI